MNLKEFTESVIALYLDKGGNLHPDVTLDIFRLIETNESLQSDYKALSKRYKEVNPTIGKTIREHFNLRNNKSIDVADQCSLIKNSMSFHMKS
jgi:hypothetical protein